MGNKTGFDILIIETNALLGKMWAVDMLQAVIINPNVITEVFNKW